MGDAPELLPCPFCGNPPEYDERLLADAGGPFVSCPYFVKTSTGDLISCEEYRYTPEGWSKRATLTAERDAAFAMGVEAAIKPLYQSLWPILGGNNLPAEMWTGIADAFDEAIRDLAPMTPLWAALALPEVRGLVEAGRLAEQQLIALGSDGFGSGLTAALAKLEAAK